MAHHLNKPLFTVIPTTSLDSIPAQQLEAILNTEQSKKAYAELLKKHTRELLHYGRTTLKEQKE